MAQRIKYSKASPDAYRAFGEVHSRLQKCGLAKELINLVNLRVSQINWLWSFCIDIHTRDLKKLGNRRKASSFSGLAPCWHAVQRARESSDRLGGSGHWMWRQRTPPMTL